MNGRGGMAPEVGNPVAQQAATDEFVVRTIRNGRIGTAMPAFQRPEAPAFSDQDIADAARLSANARRSERSESDGAERNFRNSLGRQAMNEETSDKMSDENKFKNLSRGAVLSKPP